MPLAVTVRDTSQPSIVEQRPVAATEELNVRRVESLESSVDSPPRTERIEVIVPNQRENNDEIALRAEFEGERLEAETRLALTVERVELEQTPQSSRDFLQENNRVVVFGSLSIDVQA